MEIAGIFPTPLATLIVAEPAELDEILDKHSTERSWMTIDGDHTKNSSQTFNLNVLDDFPEAKALFQRSIDHFAKDVLETPTSIQITTSWLTRTRTDGFSSFHRHKNSYISGCYYFADATREDDGQFVIQRPNQDEMMVTLGDALNAFNLGELRFTPRRGMLILFPSYLLHRVGRVLGIDDRFSLAFNTFPIGTYGQYDSQITIPSAGYVAP